MRFSQVLHMAACAQKLLIKVGVQREEVKFMKTFLIMFVGLLSVSSAFAQSRALDRDCTRPEKTVSKKTVSPNDYATITIGVIAAEEEAARESECDTALEALSRESKLAALELMMRLSNGAININQVDKTEAQYVESIKQLKAAAKAACAD